MPPREGIERALFARETRSIAFFVSVAADYFDHARSLDALVEASQKRERVFVAIPFDLDVYHVSAKYNTAVCVLQSGPRNLPYLSFFK